MRSAERGTRNGKLRNGLCLLVNGEVWLLKIRPDLPGRRPAFRCRKRGHLGHYKKSIFHPLKKCCFFAVFENRVKMLVLINEYWRLVNSVFFGFGRKKVKKGVKINIVSNLR